MLNHVKRTGKVNKETADNGMKRSTPPRCPPYRQSTRTFHLTGICAAGRTPIELAPVLMLRALRLLPSTFPSDSGKPSSSPTLKPWEKKGETGESVSFVIQKMRDGPSLI